ncbi:MAG: NUDIX domain-containing protein [Candidatus Izemoplasmatales bacterium]|nr:NUDIX domain-containing protein [Candidatus Izemoplasmatales bacterium]
MLPLMVVNDTSVEIPPKIQTREVVRAIMIADGKILLMFSNRDQMYGTPGGGITLGESKLDTLYRELLEEVGAQKIKIIENIGSTEEIRLSRSLLKPMKILTDYYHVEVLDFADSSLEEHEEDMGLEPMWVLIDEAIKRNEMQLDFLRPSNITFYYTQTKMLKYIKDRFGL